MDREPVDWNVRSPRRPTAHTATVILRDGREVRALVTNLSYEGCQLLAEAELCVGETLVLSLADRGSVQSQVRWTAGDKAGIKFLTENFSEQRRARIGV